MGAVLRDALMVTQLILSDGQQLWIMVLISVLSRALTRGLNKGGHHLHV